MQTYSCFLGYFMSRGEQFGSSTVTLICGARHVLQEGFGILTFEIVENVHLEMSKANLR